MMAHKPLHELLQEDQEPFLLKDYIADRRCQLKKPKPRPSSTTLQVKKRNPISQNFRRNACFFSVNNSPDLKRSPLFEFQSPVKSPCKSPNAIFLHIPAKTAALLLEAALRIQKQSSASQQKSKPNNGFGLFGSLIKRLTHRSNKASSTSQTAKRSSSSSIKDILKLSSSSGLYSKREKQEKGCWDLALETSSSCCGQLSEEEEMEFAKRLNIDFNCITDYDYSNDQYFCESPFHFVLKRPSPSSSSGHRTPVFLSPATSPCHHKTEGKENKNDVESLKKFKEKDKEEEEEDKEQCSPVSVLDPPFEDDDDGHDDHSEDDGFDLECSYAIVQRAKKQLLAKLRRFEKLAELDPVELEQEFNDDEDEEIVDLSDTEQKSIDTLVIEELGKSSFSLLRKVPKDMKRLVTDLINEEEHDYSYFTDREATVKRVCKRFESWKEVESNTIDMMVEEDFKKELYEWKKYQQQVGEAALEIELGIFGLLVEELSEELVDLTGI